MMNKKNALLSHKQHQSFERLLRLKESSNRKTFCHKAFLSFLPLELLKNFFSHLARKLLSTSVMLSIVSLCISYTLAADAQQREPQLVTLLSLHDINLMDESTWPNQRMVAIAEGVAPHALRFKCEPSQKRFTLSLERVGFGDVISDLLTGNIHPTNPTVLDQTFVVNGQPHFVKLSINPSYTVTLERISTPINFYMTSTTPIIIQNGVDNGVFGIVESRGASIFLGARKDVLTGFQQEGDCTEKPEHPELTVCAFSQFNNIHGGLYAPEGKLLVTARDSISNGRGIETQVTTNFSCIGINFATARTHRFVTQGNGSFMRSKARMVLNSAYISNFYNDLEVLLGDIVLQGSPGSTIRITGNVNTPQNMWIKTGTYDLQQEREPIIAQLNYLAGGSGKVGEISLSHVYPQITIGWDHYIMCDNVLINHPSQGWQPHILKTRKEYSSNYAENGQMTIRVNSGAVWLRNWDLGTVSQISQ